MSVGVDENTATYRDNIRGPKTFETFNISLAVCVISDEFHNPDDLRSGKESERERQKNNLTKNWGLTDELRRMTLDAFTVLMRTSSFLRLRDQNSPRFGRNKLENMTLFALRSCVTRVLGRDDEFSFCFFFSIQDELPISENDRVTHFAFP